MRAHHPNKLLHPEQYCRLQLQSPAQHCRKVQRRGALLTRAAGSTFGHSFRVTTFGESHGKGVGCVIDGVPPRLPITKEEVQVSQHRLELRLEVFRDCCHNPFLSTPFTRCRVISIILHMHVRGVHCWRCYLSCQPACPDRQNWTGEDLGKVELPHQERSPTHVKYFQVPSSASCLTCAASNVSLVFCWQQADQPSALLQPRLCSGTHSTCNSILISEYTCAFARGGRRHHPWNAHLHHGAQH
jgi:hypothetical protein